MKRLTRRHILRGAGVALALPWLESLQPRLARGQAAPPRRRFVSMYFPLGTPDFWTPLTTGAGAAWKLSPILEPLAPVKSRVSVLGRVDQTVYPNGVQPSNGPLTASFLTAVKCPISFPGDPNGRAGISIDQRIAESIPAGTTPLRSLQVGLATQLSYCDGTPCSYSRSISWSAPDKPLFKLVNPQEVFDAIVTGGAAPDPAIFARAKARKSVLDFVLGNAKAVQARLGRSDGQRMDQFLTSVRTLETRVTIPIPQPPACRSVARPTLSASAGNVPPGYNRDDHANVMIDLIVMALSCDATRVVSFMLDDSRSDFSYDFVTARAFTKAGSTSLGIPVRTNPVGGANSSRQDSDWATIGWWYASKMSLLSQKLAMVPDGNGASLLDNSVVWFGSGNIEEWDWRDLRVLYAGSGGGVLKVDQFVPFASTQSLSNVYLTFLRHVFGQPDASFGDSTGVIPQLLA